MQQGDQGVRSVQEQAGETAKSSKASADVDREVFGEEAKVVGKGGLALGVGDSGAETEREHVGGTRARPRHRGEEEDGPEGHGRDLDLGTWIKASTIEDAMFESALSSPATRRPLDLIGFEGSVGGTKMLVPSGPK